MVYIISGDRHDKFGKTRSEQEKNLRKEWGPTMSDAQLSKLEYHERNIKNVTGCKKNFVRGHIIDEVR